MERKLIVAATMALIALTLTSAGFATACPIKTVPPPGTLPAGLDLQIIGKGLIWLISTDVDLDGKPDFNGNLVKKSSLIATISIGYYDSDGIPIVTQDVTVEPVSVITAPGFIMLVFTPKTISNALQNEEALYTFVNGEYINGDTFVAAGPGFARGSGTH